MNITGLDKAEVLAALYNSAKPQGMGFLHFEAKPMTKEEAQQLLDKGQTYFDYVKGRVMKIEIGWKDEVYTELYNRDNGHGAAERAVNRLRNLNQDGEVR